VPTVQQILDKKGRRVFSVDAEATVLDAARLMNDHHVGALVVTRADKVVGIFTERDVLNRVMAQERDPARTAVREVMTAPVACCSPQTTWAECRTVMRSRRIRHLPVVEGEQLIGIVSIGDILEETEAQQQQTIRYMYEYVFGGWAE